MQNTLDILREIPPLLPQFLSRRRVGLPAIGETVAELGVERGVLFTLVHFRQVQGSYGDEPITLAQARAHNPYQVIDDLTAPLSVLKERGLVAEDGQGHLSLTEEGRAAVERVHAAGREHVAGLQPLSPDDLATLAGRLSEIMASIVVDPVLNPRLGSRLAGSLSIHAAGNVSPMVSIEQYVLDLWMARDDAHMAAWRDADMEGPPLAVLTLIWSGGVSTVTGLRKALKFQQTSTDIESSLAYLLDKDYIERDEDRVGLTPAGEIAREDIESDTDRIYFSAWPRLSLAEATWLRDKLAELVVNLPAPPPQQG